MQFDGADFFDGLRTFPNDAKDIHRHQSRLNYTLQKRYFVAPEVAELALQPRSEEDFQRYYRQQISRIISHFNTATRGKLKVRVDVQHPCGMQLQRDTTNNTNNNSTTNKNSTTSNNNMSADTIHARREEAGRLARADGQRTPQGASIAALLYSATDGKASDDRSTLAHSSARKAREAGEALFGTPPEFTGFHVPLEGTPEESIGGKSPVLF